MTEHQFSPWLKSYPADVPPEVDTRIFNSILDMY